MVSRCYFFFKIFPSIEMMSCHALSLWKGDDAWPKLICVLVLVVKVQVRLLSSLFSGNQHWCSEVAESPVPASSSDSSRFWVCQILQVNERQMCGDSTTLIRLNQCHTVTTGQLEASLVTQCLLHSAKTSSDSPGPHLKSWIVLGSLFCLKWDLLG